MTDMTEPTMTATARAPRFHVALRASKARFDDTVGFYEKLFGVTAAKRRAGYAKLDLVEPPLNLTFNEVDEVKHGDLDHLGIQVWSDDALGEARSRAQAAGLSIYEEPQVECCYAQQDKFWVTDPDGRSVEVFHTLRDLEHHGKQHATPADASSAKPAKKGLLTIQTGGGGGCCS